MIRPTHVLDPEIVICPREGQLERLLREISATRRANDRALVMAVTKRDAEDVAAWLVDEGVRASYIHSDLNTVERAEVLQQLQGGACEVLVGVNLLREGLRDEGTEGVVPSAAAPPLPPPSTRDHPSS